MNKILLLLTAGVLGTLGSLAFASDETDATAIAVNCDPDPFNQVTWVTNSPYGDVQVTQLGIMQYGGDVDFSDCDPTQPCKWFLKVAWANLAPTAVSELCVKSGPTGTNCYPGWEQCIATPFSSGSANIPIRAPCDTTCTYEVIAKDSGGNQVKQYGTFSVTCNQCQ